MKRKFKDVILDKFFSIVASNEIELITRMITDHPVLANVIQSDTGNSVLFYALRQKRYKLAKVLIEKGADINFVSPWGQSIIEQCFSAGAINVARVLLEYKNFQYSSITSINIPSRFIHASLGLLKRIEKETGKKMEDFLSAETMNSIKTINHHVEDKYSQKVTEDNNSFLEDLLGFIENNSSFENLSELDSNKKETIQESILSYNQVRAPLMDAVHNQEYLIIEVPRDGNCFFSSIAVLISQIYDPRKYAAQAHFLRKLAAEYIRGNPEEFLSFFEDNEIFNARAHVYFYADRLEENGEEVDHPMMQALADELRIDIVVHQGNMIYYINSRTVMHASQYHIFYDGRHYDALFATSPDIIEEYDDFLNQEWFLTSLEGYQAPVDIEPDDFFGLYGITAMLFYAQHKFIDA